MNSDEQFAASMPPELVAPGVIHPAETLISRLVLGGSEGKANFDAFVDGLDLVAYMVAEPSQHINWKGHPTTVCKIRAESWQTESLKVTQEQRLVFPNSARHFDVHFELQVLQWKSRMALYLHYETNPYFSEANLKASADQASLAQYYQRREDFIREFTALGEVVGFAVRPGIVQIGRATYDFGGKTVEEVSAWVQPVIEEVACHVNDALDRVDEARRMLAQRQSPIVEDAARLTAENFLLPPLSVPEITRD